MSDTTSGRADLFADADIPTLIDIWESAGRDFLAFVSTLDDDQWSVPTPCPAWSVGDIVAHIDAVDRELVDGITPTNEPDWSALPNVRDDDVSRYTERGVDARRSLTREEQLASLADTLTLRAAQLRSAAYEPGTKVPAFFGSMRPIEVVLRMRTFDTWVHEQDIREAVGIPGNLGSDGAAIAAYQVCAALPMVVARRADAPVGAAVEWDVSGDVRFTRVVQVALEGQAVVRSGAVDPAEITTGIAITWPAFMALAAGRVIPPAVMDDVTLTGDRALGLRLLAALSIAP